MALRATPDLPPLRPDPDEARRWAEQELSDPAYRAAEPTGLDRLARDVAERLQRLFDNDPGADIGQFAAVIVIVVVVVVAVAAFLVWGRPRLTARAGADASLFGAASAMSAAEYRAAAHAAAARGEWDTAIIERVRGIARSLGERLIVEAPPGATVHAFAVEAAYAFPSRRADLDAAARAFDDVRYLRRPGTADAYAAVTALDEALAAARPVQREALA